MTNCALVDATIEFEHLQSIDSGELQKEILLNAHDDIHDSVSAQLDFEIQYVGDPILKSEFVFTLHGVPIGLPMNAPQKRYYERVTLEFFNNVLDDGIPIFQVVVGEEVMLTTGRRHLRSIRGLQEEGDQVIPTGKTQIAAMVYGAGKDEAKLRSGVLAGVSDNVNRYITELSVQQLRPGEINKQDAGQFFESITNIQVQVKPDNFGQPGAGGSNGSGRDGTVPCSADTNEPCNDGGQDNGLWMILSIVGMVFGLSWFLVRLYLDLFHSEKFEKQIVGGKDNSSQGGFDEGDYSSSSDEGDGKRPFFPGPPPRTPSGCGSLDGLPLRSNRDRRENFNRYVCFVTSGSIKDKTGLRIGGYVIN